ncbi:hypothetical protein BJ138DRAFT_1105928 [Hygrophoropsis aurantiaca]|uniref:Uncharacterized protein n=1 Tax=Hygrophoropsis aurantiaca TaxID=72124 RepID=A0ACB7ZX21_9AGAM|nr:hypothetical protein BJ138DRAFT_1105928 [Hygrophoropsis aurantiaca]
MSVVFPANLPDYPPIDLASHSRSRAAVDGGPDDHDKTFKPFMRRIWFEFDRNQKILEFHAPTKQLKVWRWPLTDTRTRVAPEDLNNHRVTHNFLGPGCLCASLTTPSTDNSSTEALIFKPASGNHAGKWVASCASRTCGYWVILQHHYKMPYLPVYYYPPRTAHSVLYLGDSGETPTEPNTPTSSQSPQGSAPYHIPAIEGSDKLIPERCITPTPATKGLNAVANAVRLGKRKRAEVDVNPFIVQVTPKLRPPVKPDAFSLLMRLDSVTDGGLTVKEFKNLLTSALSTSENDTTVSPEAF